MSDQNQSADLDAILASVEDQNQNNQRNALTEEERFLLQNEVDGQHLDYIRSLLAHQVEQPKSDDDIKILMVDDSSMARRFIAAMLDGFKVIFDHADNGAQAIEALKCIKDYDLVTMDFNMPGLNGLETFKATKQHQVPTIMITTESEKTVICDALMEGISNYILKPVQKDEFLKKVVDVLYKNNKQLSKRV